MNQPPEKQSWTTVLYYTPRRGHLITSVCLRVGLYLCSVVSYGPKEEMLVLSSYVQARWIQVALHLLGSWLLTAYILLSYDRFLSTLKHFRPSDVVSVRNNNGFWWGSVSKAIAGLLHSLFSLYSVDRLAVFTCQSDSHWGAVVSDTKRRETQLFLSSYSKTWRVCDIS